MRPTPAEAPRRGPSLAASLYEHLRADILFARLKPGERLRSDALRLRYGASVGTLREALNRLRAEGLVDQEDQRGFRVAAVGRANLRELTKTRCWINGIAVRESVEHGDAAWEENVLLAFHRLTRAGGYGGPDRSESVTEMHRTFHASLYAACGSQRLIDFAGELFDSAVRYQSLAITVDPDPRDIAGEHRRIMEAAIARDATQTVMLLERHLWDTTERLERVLTFAGNDG